ncbi:DUF6383 domain-containing protein [Parabacteroides sp. AM08-6]|uniref:DUF6383 domain-containing protein n=1 Tax=Parabacteroides sp. AM08-6 TaxID=2292053 RepID=UPI000EFED2B4|nr:DUF6383 domain-containing protein [Parabacteroides sp. AM08-6]RHJ82440.1 hypothetical protein DW103_09780 [Parabacteroides sp. AM08-6]
MNKKFSTLLASALLAVSSFSANAANVTADAVPSLSLTEDNGLVQIAVGDPTSDITDYLAIENDSLKLVPAANAQGDLFLNTLWCVTVEKYNQGQAVKYKFTNKATSQELNISSDYLKDVVAGGKTDNLEVAVDGDITGWAFSNNLGTLATEKPMYYYFDTDSVVAFVKGDQALDGVNYAVKLQKYESTYDNDYSGALAFSLVYANEMTLSAKQINSMLGMLEDDTDGVKLAFTPNKNKISQTNYFTDDYFLADTVAQTGDEKFVRILTKDSSYVYVDTAYLNTNGEKFLRFNTIKATADKMGGKSIADSLKAALNDQSKFLFRYWPSKDSLVIQVKQSTMGNADGVFNTNTPAPVVIDNTGKVGSEYKNYVTVQDLYAADDIRVVTIYDKKEVEINFGIGSCTALPPSHKTAIAEGLYLIRNTEGQYLAVPIHGDSTMVWVSREDNVEPWDMPAFQWVVEKNGTANKITNREFAKETLNIQFLDNADATILGATVKVEVGAGKAFEAASAAIMKDKYLGYRLLDKDSMRVQTYKLKYWTSFADKDLYMGASKTNDSIIYIGAKDNYVIAAVGDIAEYGYTGNVSGLTKLYRQAYTMKSKAANKYVVEAAENRYAISENVEDMAKFFYKANNNVEGVKYYALIDTAYAVEPDLLRKVGVDENNKYLKAQVMTESRTSAFTVEIDDAPLYRRFNNPALEENVSDGPDSLRFYESRRGEYLMDENNQKWQNDGVDYLGIWSENKATGLAFRIDTAWVKRGLGYIKPQYLISVDRHEVAAVDTIPCDAKNENHKHMTPDGKETTDAKECIHATPGKAGYTVAKYLVSFADSVTKYAGKDEVLPYVDVANGYTRVGFVKAIRQNDDMIFLTNGYEKMDVEKLNVDEIIKAYKDAGIDGTYIKSLKGDDHKNYTWSFRYTDPDAAATVAKEGEANQFLIESNTYDGGKDIQPEHAAWIKMQNGCIVLTNKNSEFNNAKTGGDGALIFNVENKLDDELATDNEEIATSEVSVLAGEGQVTIANAAGKKVVVSDMLGRVVVNTVISSDNATIAVPVTGVVAVAVEGEAAVKAMVK